MKLLELFKAVQEPNLNKAQLEQYHLELTGLYGQLMLEMSDLEKQEAVYFLEYTEMAGEKMPDVAIKRKWRGTEGGQRLIELKNYDKAITKMLASLKSRLYSLY